MGVLQDLLVSVCLNTIYRTLEVEQRREDQHGSCARMTLKFLLPFRYEGERKTFPDKQKLREFITICPALQEMKGAPLLETDR